ncbi:MAG: DNA alkylation repair protein [Anaerolineales bacterium]|nr:DNA alkylation repair protein [Anaerolineales bacterium]MCX7754957.1 DNA alkylation repair protein [Anaerolineales bacterium]MDW8277335.1 DNA alkylation repair protein [Anaerolineales bacterium]
MPAIDIARLKTQAAVLVQKFDQPAVFVDELREILDLYADRTLRVGIAAPATVLPAYRVPQAVLRQIEMELAPLAASFPEQALMLGDALWAAGYLETRLLAAALLGKIHPNAPQLTERVKEWVSQARDKQLRNALLNNGLARLRREMPERLLQLVQEWFDPRAPKMWENGIYALIPLLEDPSYDNLPPIYNMLTPVIQNIPPFLQTELADLLTALYRASPVETAYFLRQAVAGATSPQCVVILKRLIPALPEAFRPIVLEISASRQRKTANSAEREG